MGYFSDLLLRISEDAGRGDADAIRFLEEHNRKIAAATDEERSWMEEPVIVPLTDEEAEEEMRRYERWAHLMPITR